MKELAVFGTRRGGYKDGAGHSAFAIKQSHPETNYHFGLGQDICKGDKTI
jgi:hypothetical protein